MNRATPRARHWRGSAGFLAAAIMLAGCGTTVASSTVVTGVPSLSIDVPLTHVGCTSHGSCIAIGSTDSNLSPSTIGEVRSARGSWSALVTPPTAYAIISSIACWADGCLIGGSNPSIDLLWVYNGTTRLISPLATLDGGHGVKALSCFADSSCALVDTTGTADDTRLLFTNDGGSTWSTATSVPWLAGDVATSLACTSALDCVVGATTPASHAAVEVTRDGGATWTIDDVPPTWTTVRSLQCVRRHCVGLAASSSESYVIRSSTFSRTWRATPLGASAVALACTDLTHCVVVGQRTKHAAWLALYDTSRLSATTLHYVPTPLSDVACSTTTCVANAVSTLLSVRPSS